MVKTHRMRSWFLSLLFTLAIVAGGVWFFVACIQMGVSSFANNLPDYRKALPRREIAYTMAILMIMIDLQLIYGKS